MWLLKDYFRPLKQNPEDLAFPTGRIKYRSVNALSMSLAAGMIKFIPIVPYKSQNFSMQKNAFQNLQGE